MIILDVEREQYLSKFSLRGFEQREVISKVGKHTLEDGLKRQSGVAAFIDTKPRIL